MPHPELTLERRIDAELCGLDAKMCVYADDLQIGRASCRERV